jgi:subfamily B ATP-binding cassette protein MsbA
MPRRKSLVKSLLGRWTHQRRARRQRKQNGSPKPSFFQILKFISRYASRQWGLLALLVGLNVAVTMLATWQMAMTAAILNILTGHNPSVAAVSKTNLNNIGALAQKFLGIQPDQHPFEGILLIAGIVMGSVLLSSAFKYTAGVLGEKTGAIMARRMQLDLTRHLMRFSMAFFNQSRVGELMSHIESDTQAAMQNFQRALNGFTVSFLLLAFYLVLIVKASWVLFAGLCIAAGLHILISRGVQKPLRKSLQKDQGKAAELRSLLQEILTSIRTVKSFGAEQYEIDKMSASTRSHVNTKVRIAKIMQITQPLREIINNLILLIILLSAAYEYLHGRIQLPTCLLYVFICRAIVTPMSELSESFNLTFGMVSMTEKIYSYFQVAPDLIDGTTPIRGFSHKLRLEEVTFAYTRSPVLKKMDLEIRKGEMVALVGPSGAGKSTLMDLVLRLYDPSEGAITLDGKNIRDFLLADYRTLFGVVSQEPLLFNCSIRENIAYGRPSLSTADIERAAEIANATSFILELPEKYDTQVGDRGIRLSGGQRQRIAIARALAGRPEILLLDEATSALDSESEREVQSALTRAMENSTAIVIAHRLSTILHADKIVVLEKGRVADIGRHLELLERCPLYQRLCEIQFVVRKAAPTPAP